MENVLLQAELHSLYFISKHDFSFSSNQQQSWNPQDKQIPK